jgi:hypothetical protein
VFAAITGIAILLGWASWGGWVKSDAVAYLSIAVLAGVFSLVARQCLRGACIVVGVIWLTGILDYLERDPIYGSFDYRVVSLATIWSSSLFLLCSAAFLRAHSRISVWMLVASLVLVELFIAARLLYFSGGWSTLYETLAPKSQNGVHGAFIAQMNRVFLTMRFRDQRWYIAAPWLLGIAIGEIIARRRKI